VVNNRTGEAVPVPPTSRYQTASVMKIDILAAVLLARAGRRPVADTRPSERSPRRLIRASDYTPRPARSGGRSAGTTG
jgi:hypothetical protein